MPANAKPMLIPSLEPQLAPDLSDFLEKPQRGTRAVTRSMIDRVLRVRYGQVSAAPTTSADVVPEGELDRLGSQFAHVPYDTGHWGHNYFDHVLNPLRQAPPGYVLSITAGDFIGQDLASSMPDNIAGVVVAQLHGTGNE
jgi:hypothetical protein